MKSSGSEAAEAGCVISTPAVQVVLRPAQRRAIAEERATPCLTVTPLQDGLQEIQVQGGGCLYEQTDYVLFVQSQGAAAVHVRHRDPVLIGRLHTTADGRVVHGTLNFGAQVGRSRFVVAVGARPHLAFEVEVFPSKLDYRQDYDALREDVQSITRALVLSYLRTTYSRGRPAALDRPALLSWTLLLRHVMADLERAVAFIAAHPVRDAASRAEAVRVEQIQQPDTGIRRAVRSGRGHGAWQRTRQGVPVRTMLPASRSRYTLDTPEHRWLARHLAAAQADLAALRRQQAGQGGRRSARIVEELASLHEQMQRLLSVEPLSEASGSAPEIPSLRLMQAPGYREAYQACRMLRQALHVTGGPVALALKDLHLLYEYWCFLTLVQRCAEWMQQRLPVASLLQVVQEGLQVRLRRGSAQTVRLQGPGQVRVSLTYNPRFDGAAYLLPQQPDMLLTVRRKGGAAQRYVVDAKYRLDATPAYVRRFGSPGPPPEALNSLHRYRDALRDRQGGRMVRQAVALFPFRESQAGAYRESRLWKGRARVGVGAIPLLPGATTYLDEWLEGVLALPEGPGAGSDRPGL